MAVPCYCSPQNIIIASEKIFLFWFHMNAQKYWKPKLESAYSFTLKYSKITACILSKNHFQILLSLRIFRVYLSKSLKFQGLYILPGDFIKTLETIYSPLGFYKVPDFKKSLRHHNPHYTSLKEMARYYDILRHQRNYQVGSNHAAINTVHFISNH